MKSELTPARIRALGILSSGGIPVRAFGAQMWPKKKGHSPRTYLMHLTKFGWVEEDTATGCWSLTPVGVETYAAALVKV